MAYTYIGEAMICERCHGTLKVGNEAAHDEWHALVESPEFLASESVRGDVLGDEYDGLSFLEDEEGDDLVPQSMLERLAAAEAEVDAAERAILRHIGVEDFAGLRARRHART